MRALKFVAATVLMLGMVLSVQAADRAEIDRLRTEVDGAIKAFKRLDPSMSTLFTNAAGYAVFPSVGKGGFIVGGAHGKGLAYQKGVLIGYASLTQVTFGAQVGGQEFAEVIFFETEEALNDFKGSAFNMSAQVSAVAAAEGASENARYVDGVIVFTRPKQGLMVEATVGGQKFEYEAIAK
jgi:lipid-binding SYLF domain-containing protein